MHFHALGRTKPLKKEVIVAMYSPQAVRMAAKGSRNSDDLFDMIFCSPPSQMDMTWTRKKNKRGLKSPSETWPRGLYATCFKGKADLVGDLRVAVHCGSGLRFRRSPRSFLFRLCRASSEASGACCMPGDCVIAFQACHGIQALCAKESIFHPSSQALGHT